MYACARVLFAFNNLAVVLQDVGVLFQGALSDEVHASSGKEIPQLVPKIAEIVPRLALRVGTGCFQNE